VHIVKGRLVESLDTALLILRVWLGSVMLAHGVNHARSIDGTTSWFASKGFRQARLNARGSALGEIAIGLGLVVGLLTAPAAAGLIATMTVAVGSIHRFAGFFVFKRPDEGWEYVATLAVATLAIATTGPGAVSLDAAFGLDETLSGWIGFGIGLAGVLAGIGQLAVFWRRPGTEEMTAINQPGPAAETASPPVSLPRP
jgi:putative oxidoreductase